MKSAKNQIETKISKSSFGKIFFLADFSKYGSSDNIRKVLSRLENEEVTINSFYNDDPIVAREEAFSFLRNYINVLKEENQVEVETKYSGPRNHAQFRFDSRTKNFDDNLSTYFVSHLVFKDSKLNKGLKIYVVVDETFYTSEDFIDEHERTLVFLLGNQTEDSLIE